MIRFLSTPSARRATQSGRPDRDRCVIFYPRPPRGRATDGNGTLRGELVGFLSTPSARRATRTPPGGKNIVTYISIHALREEGDPVTLPHQPPRINFYPRPPRGGRRGQAVHQALHQVISIHALREEGDFDRFVPRLIRQHFYPRPPRGRPTLWLWLPCRRIFLSTPSARRATAYRHSQADVVNFYPRPPQGGRRKLLDHLIRERAISIHALRKEGDVFGMLPFRSVKNFYPRPPRGGRPPVVARGYPSAKISIHALREGATSVVTRPSVSLAFLSTPSARRDAGPQLRERPERDFYPRPPRGGRPLTVRLSALPRSFLSTPSARRATSASLPCRSPARFLSTPSARRATYLLTVPPTSIKISIHALREEGDDVGVDDVVHIARFLSTPSARRAT